MIGPPGLPKLGRRVFSFALGGPGFTVPFGLLIAGVAGLLYARDLARGFRAAALGGGAAGASCGVVAVAASNLFGDRPDLYIPWGVMVLTFTGIVGGMFGQLDAIFKAFIRSQK